MEVILSRQCASLTGTIDSKNGYAIQRRGNRFFSVRPNNKFVQPDAHWDFIVLCAELAKSGLYITDIRVKRTELFCALMEAGYTSADLTLGANSPSNESPVPTLSKREFNATDVLSLSSFIASVSNSDIKIEAG